LPNRSHQRQRRAARRKPVTPRENLTTALQGGAPEQTPLSVLDWLLADHRYSSEEWRLLLDQGLCLAVQCQTVRLVEHGVETTVGHRVEGDRRYTIRRKETPAGTVQCVTVNSVRRPRLMAWTQEHWVKRPTDYRILAWIAENTEVLPQYEAFARAEERAGDQGVIVVLGGRSPALTIQIDYAGGERFALDLARRVDELFELHEAERKLFLEVNRAIAAGPGGFVTWCEQLTIDMLGPGRYAELLMPVYAQAAPVHESAGKRVLVQYDGKLRAAADLIARAPFHIVEMVTEPPEGDMTLDECRAAWPDKVLWANINVGLYGLPPAELGEAIIAMRQRAGKRGLALAIAEDIPENWRDSVPVVLQTLQELD
jgi:hypothetical protein